MIFFFSVKKSNKKRKATSTPHLSVKNDSDRKRHRRINKNKSNGNRIYFSIIQIILQATRLLDYASHL